MSTAKSNLKLNVIADKSPESPRKWCNLGTIVAEHKRYELSDEHGWNDAVEIIEAHFSEAQLENLEFDPSDLHSVCSALAATGKAVILPLYMYEHSGVALRTTPFSCQWDSGIVGFIFVMKADLRAEYGWKRITASRLNKAESVLSNEIAVYSDYIDGDTWGYEIVDEEDEVVESCWGFFGYDPVSNGMLGHLPQELVAQVKAGNYQRAY